MRPWPRQSGAKSWWWALASGGPTRRRPTSGAWWNARRSLWWWTRTGCTHWASSTHRCRLPVSSASAVVLTPHDGEYRRLMGQPPGRDRIAAAQQLAERAGAVALVKGTTTAVGEVDGRVVLGLAGTPALATAGTGDVLSGVIGAFVARGVAPLEAAGLAAHVHGRAAANGATEGLVAGDLPQLVSGVLSRARDASTHG
jgi:NAD(P)H-hydrate repair Nnr-like enzyme with NAD(P)H-hydrate dehydratase domain